MATYFEIHRIYVPLFSSFRFLGSFFETASHISQSSTTRIYFQVETLSHEGRGIAHYGSHPDHPADKHGKKVFRYALPGEMVKAQITHEAKRLKKLK